MPFQATTYKLTVRLLGPLLGSQPDADIKVRYVAKKAGVKVPDAELETLTDRLADGLTVFHKRDGQPMLWGYMVRGFLREAAEALNDAPGVGVKQLKDKIGKWVFVTPHEIPLIVPELEPEPAFITAGGNGTNGQMTKGKMGRKKASLAVAPAALDVLSRPLRAKTPYGERSAIQSSERLPIGTGFVCRISIIDGKKSEITEEVLRCLLDYGYVKGLGQWRNSGYYGTFTYTLEKE